jgi:hypothetical protein
VADLDEAGWEDVEEEPAEECLGRQAERAAVLGPKRHGVVGDGDEALVGETDTMSVAAEVLEESLRPPEGTLHVDVPGGSVERTDRAPRRHGIGRRQVTAGEALLELSEHLAPKERAEDLHGKEMSLAGGTPPTTIGREPAGRDDAVDVGMKLELPGPGVEHGREAELSPESLRVAPEGEEGLGGRPHEERKDPTAIGEGDGSQGCREREDDVEVVDVDDTLHPLVDPAGLREALALRAVPVAARVVGRSLEAAA